MSLTLEEFGQRIKSKYPQYANLGDADIAQKVIEKYPQYSSQVESKTKVNPLIAGPMAIGANHPKEITKAGVNIFRDVTKPVVQSLARPVQAASLLAGGPSHFDVPFYGDITPKQNFKQALGTALQTASLGLGPVEGGAGLLGGQAMAEGKPLLEVGLKAAGGALLGKGGEMVAGAVGNLMKPLTSSKIDEMISKEVEKGITKGIRPSVFGKGTASKVTDYFKDAVDGVKAIIKNKPSLRFENEAGQIESRIPKSLSDYANAIEQTKQKVYEEYTNLASRAGDKGAGFNIRPIFQKIKSAIIDTKKYSPEVREYALNKLKSLSELQGSDPLTIQSRIEELNSTLQSYYRGSTTKINADIDATIAKMMREQLDEMITSKTGSAYKPLKKLYGSLKSLEGDVNHRSIVYARQAPKGLLDGATDLFTGERIASATVKAFTGRPIGAITDVSQAGAVKALNLIRQKINNPDRMVEKMFSNVDGLMSRGEEIAARRASAKTMESISLAPKQLPAPEARLGLPAPEGPKLLGVNPRSGEGFETVPKGEAFQRLKNFAFKYWSPTKMKLEIPEGEVVGSSDRGLLKKFGIDPYTGEIKYPKVKTALEIAMKRKTNI